MRIDFKQFGRKKNINLSYDISEVQKFNICYVTNATTMAESLNTMNFIGSFATAYQSACSSEICRMTSKNRIVPCDSDILCQLDRWMRVHKNFLSDIFVQYLFL